MKKYIIILLLTTFYLPLWAQSLYDTANTAKYWRYKERLNEDFVVVGYGDKGYSIPAGGRLSNGGIGWGDGNEFGYYLAVLGTEYKLLKDSKQDLTTNRWELYCALEAVNRLDQIAESYFRESGNVLKSDLNGFWLRDDITVGFFDAHKNHFNQGKYCKSEVNYLSSEFINATPAPEKSGEKYADEMSVDNMYNMFLGLSMVITCVDSTDNYTHRFADSSGSVFNNPANNFVTEAKNIVRRIAKMLDGNDYFIKNPVTGNCVCYRGGCACSDLNPFERSAADGQLRAYPAIKAMEFMLQSNINYTDNNYVDASKAFWEESQYAGKFYRHEFYKNLLLAAISDSWRNMFLLMPFIEGTKNTTPQKILSGSERYNYIHFPLMYAVLHHYALDSAYMDKVALRLNMAPPNGPYLTLTEGGFTYAPYWAKQNNIKDAENPVPEKPWDNASREFVGLDYMLLHNLYYILKEK